MAVLNMFKKLVGKSAVERNLPGVSDAQFEEFLRDVKCVESAFGDLFAVMVDAAPVVPVVAKPKFVVHTNSAAVVAHFDHANRPVLEQLSAMAA